MRQFLAAHKIVVPEKAIDQQVQDLRENPPSLGCPCCRYGSLDQYLEASYLTMDDLRTQLRGKIGMERYADELWKQTYPTPESQERLIAARRAEIARDYVRAWHLFFNTFQQIGQDGNPREIEARKRAK